MLNELDKKNPFKVPPKYFENFSGDMMAKLPEKEKPANNVVRLWTRILPWTAVAAVLCVLASVSISKNTPQQLRVAQSTQKEHVIINSDTSSDDDFYNYIQDESIEGAYQEALYAEN